MSLVNPYMKKGVGAFGLLGNATVKNSAFKIPAATIRKINKHPKSHAAFDFRLMLSDANDL